MGYIVIVGKSASGKSTVANILSEDFKYKKAVTAVSYTHLDVYKRQIVH